MCTDGGRELDLFAWIAFSLTFGDSKGLRLWQMSGKRSGEPVLLPQVGGAPSTTSDGADRKAVNHGGENLAPTGGFSEVASHQEVREGRGRSEKKKTHGQREDGRSRERSRQLERPARPSTARRPQLENDPKKPRLETTSDDELIE